MPKRKNAKANVPKKSQRATCQPDSVEHDANTSDVVNVSVTSNHDDFLDNIEATINKKRKYVNSFYRSENAPG